MKLAIIIPTTNGPVRIERITRLIRAPLSQVITSDDFVPNAKMASRYHALIDQSGPLRGLITLNGVRFELCLDRVPEMGRSWELAVVLAHWILDQGHELVTSEAELVVWATGVVKSDREIAEEDYHLESKLTTSQALLDTLGEHARLVVLLPGNTDNAQVVSFRTELDQAVVVKVDDIDAAVTALKQRIVEETPVAEHLELSSGSKQQPVRKKWRVASGVIIALLITFAGFVIVQLPSQDGPILLPVGTATADPVVQSSTPAAIIPEEDTAIPEEDTESATGPTVLQILKPIESAIPAPDILPPLLLVEHRAPSGASCVEVLFGAAIANRIEKPRLLNEFPGSNLAGLCALSFELGGEPTDALLKLPSEFLARVISSDRVSSINLGGSSLHQFHIVDGAVSLVYEVIFVGVGGEQMILKHTLMEP